MKEIELSQGMVALVDDEDYEYLNQWKWYAYKNKNTYYAKRFTKRINKKRYSVQMHRIIMDTPNKLQVDHIDHNGLNNQKYNLRNCTFTQNRMNRIRNKNNTSNYKGVTHDDGYIYAQINANGKHIRLGSFKTEKDAALAYDKAAQKYHGEFAYLNFS